MRSSTMLPLSDVTLRCGRCNEDVQYGTPGMMQLTVSATVENVGRPRVSLTTLCPPCGKSHHVWWFEGQLRAVSGGIHDVREEFGDVADS